MEDSLILHLLYNQPNTWQTQSGQTPAVPRRLTLAETYMRDHLSAPLTLTDIARHAGASATALTRLFQEHRDTTPMNALRALRLDTARQQLKTNATGQRDRGRAGCRVRTSGKVFGVLPRTVRRTAKGDATRLMGVGSRGEMMGCARWATVQY